MEQVTVGPKYQIIIPKKIRNKLPGLKPGDKVTVKQIDQKTVSIKVEETNWIERTGGMLAKELKGIDTTKYLDNLRDEWEHKNS
ncbi:MAG: hypothetical protein US86_C0007G0095 [Candidatus Daviesbacteria bacterium GW2011_GWA2_38_24]|uniref:SpoVT-AbrB domain-containing protein n=1 Tax=Candidatus Daviesbacteria bacterium GW2011_GWA2_38_24 TaxID=1618422 RepID=A0A0G0JSE8_9BACT|nr:MAG: hypothetical protein US86_C0007G0095 [Candidatus Daviesbacteria bacterium GW2011_GWA2_38_24]KKQ78783.1 MAG: hypothetical protein UT01_C0060G0017 [Candidatus Daviesbacteria bacterium GW2011_GWA1_38_7]OGE22702.1 MAG: hypothetical protein A2688_02845 [Candidatus Daviesbacteria bacterium RIFCSPHIGHO2_01_FULL_38_8]